MNLRIVPILLAIWVGFSVPALAQEVGAYFSLVNTYIYAEGPKKGPRYLVKARQAYTVVDQTVDEEEILWYQIIFPLKTKTMKGLGWTPTSPHEIVAGQQNLVLVFPEIPDNGQGIANGIRVPIYGMELLNESVPSGKFAEIDWQKVRYQIEVPIRAWVRDATGIFRPAKSEFYLSRVYGEMVTRNVDKKKVIRFLSGMVRIGDSIQEVNWALGEPLRSQEETVGNAQRVTWQYPELTVQFENSVVKLIN